MAQSAEIRHDVGFLSTLPLGSIIAWHRDLLEQGVLSLPPGWVECNGQKLDDPESRFHGSLIPNLNLVDRDDALAGHEAGAFLRGAPKSGDFQQDQLQSHTHRDAGHTHPRNPEGVAERVLIVPDEQRDGHQPEGGDGNSTPVGELTGEGRARLGNPTASGAGAPRHGAETRPVNMSVIWIMKVRQLTAAQAVPAVLAHVDAPDGAILVAADGKVGVGTANPRATLEVAGGLRLAEGVTVQGILTDATTAGNPEALLPTLSAVEGLVNARLPTQQSGRARVGPFGEPVLQDFAVNFSSQFLETPFVVATAVQDPAIQRGSRPDTFAVTITAVTKGGFTSNIARVDARAGWEQDLELSWHATLGLPG